MVSTTITISQAIEAYLHTVGLSRSQNTARTYKNGTSQFIEVLKQHQVNPEETSVGDLKEDAIAWLAEALKSYSSASERLYLTAVSGFYEYLAAEELATINLPRIRLLIRQRARKPGIRLPQFPADAIDQLLTGVEGLISVETSDHDEHLRNLRDRAFLITLADTGLRVHEACALRRGDVDWNEGKAIIIGKGNKQAVIRFSKRSLEALKFYLKTRSTLDGSSGKALSSMPVFARHDKGAGKKIKPITTTTGRNIVAERVKEFLGEDAVGTITPHSMRHYFVTRVLRGSGNLKLAQELARHENIAVTQRYAHLSDDELDRGYYETIENK